MSRQRKYQLLNKAKGLCVCCPKPLFNKTHCVGHAAIIRDRQARKHASKKQYACASRIAQTKL